jgi:hypothetical protein
MKEKNEMFILFGLDLQKCQLLQCPATSWRRQIPPSVEALIISLNLFLPYSSAR